MTSATCPEPPSNRLRSGVIVSLSVSHLHRNWKVILEKTFFLKKKPKQIFCINQHQLSCLPLFSHKTSSIDLVQFLTAWSVKLSLYSISASTGAKLLSEAADIGLRCRVSHTLQSSQSWYCLPSIDAFYGQKDKYVCLIVCTSFLFLLRNAAHLLLIMMRCSGHLPVNHYVLYFQAHVTLWFTAYK